MMEKEETKVVDTELQQGGIIDINIDGAVPKTKFRINGRNDCVVELNLSDMGIAERLEQGYQKLREFVLQATEIDMDDSNVSSALKSIDTEMRKTVDYIFDSNISEVCCKGGTMLDPRNGMYRFETIIDGLTKLYADNLNSEYQKIKKRIDENAQKYIPQDHKKSKSQKKRIEIQKDDE